MSIQRPSSKGAELGNGSGESWSETTLPALISPDRTRPLSSRSTLREILATAPSKSSYSSVSRFSCTQRSMVPAIAEAAEGLDLVFESGLDRGCGPGVERVGQAGGAIPGASPGGIGGWRRAIESTRRQREG